MAFQKGNTGKPKGAANKTTEGLRKILREHFYKNGGLQDLLTEIQGMDCERDRVHFQIKLLEVIMPKQKEIEISNFPSFKFEIVEDYETQGAIDDEDSESKNKDE